MEKGYFEDDAMQNFKKIANIGSNSAWKFKGLTDKSAAWNNSLPPPLKKIFRLIFYIDINTHTDWKWKMIKNLLKKLFLKNV